MLFCGSANVVRNGLRGRKQLYKCKVKVAGIVLWTENDAINRK